MSSLNVALVQTDIRWLDPSTNMANLEQQLLAHAVKLNQVDLIVLPETFATGFAFDQPQVGEVENGPILQWMKRTSKRMNAVLVGSVAVQCEGKNANRLYWVKPDGRVEYYDKHHLFRMAKEHEHVVAGNRRVVFELNGFRIFPIICYDLRFPVWTRNQNDYDVLLNVANWPAVRKKVWDTLLQARAMENQCYVLGVNRIGDDGRGIAHSGGTAIYDYKGDTLCTAKDNQAQVIIYPLALDKLNNFKQQFPAYLDGDRFQLLD